MSRRFPSFPALLFTALAAVGLGACGERASGETQGGASASAPAAPARAARIACPSVEQVSAAAGFEVRLAGAISRTQNFWMACQYEMTGRYRGTFLELMGDPASKADSVFEEMTRTVKGMKGIDAEPEQIAVGSRGMAFGSNSASGAAAVIGSRVWHARLVYLMSGSIGDQKEALIRVLELAPR